MDKGSRPGVTLPTTQFAVCALNVVITDTDSSPYARNGKSGDPTFIAKVKQEGLLEVDGRKTQSEAEKKMGRHNDRLHVSGYIPAPSWVDVEKLCQPQSGASLEGSPKVGDEISVGGEFDAVVLEVSTDENNKVDECKVKCLEFTEVDGWVHVKARNGQLLVEPLELPRPGSAGTPAKPRTGPDARARRDELYAAVERELRAAKSWRGIIYEVRRLYTLVHKEIADRLIIYNMAECIDFIQDGAELKTATLDTLEELYHEVQKWYDTSQVSLSYYSDDIRSQDTEQLEKLTVATGHTAGLHSAQAATSSAAPHPPLPRTSYVLTKRQRRRLANRKDNEVQQAQVLTSMDVPVFFAKKYDKWPVPLLMQNLDWYQNLVDYAMDAFWIPNKDFSFEYIDNDGRAVTVNDIKTLKEAVKWNIDGRELNFLIVHDDVQKRKRDLAEQLRTYIKLCREQNPAVRKSMAGSTDPTHRGDEVWEVSASEQSNLERLMRDAEKDRAREGASEKLLDALTELINRNLVEGIDSMIHYLDSDPSEQIDDLEHLTQTIHNATCVMMGDDPPPRKTTNSGANLMKMRAAGMAAGTKKKSKCLVM